MNQEIITESKLKLIKIMDRKIVLYGIASLLDLTTIVSTPFIVNDVASKTVDEYAKKAIITSGTILFAYELDRGIRNIRMTKFLLDKKEEIL